MHTISSPRTPRALVAVRRRRTHTQTALHPVSTPGLVGNSTGPLGLPDAYANLTPLSKEIVALSPTPSQISTAQVAQLARYRRAPSVDMFDATRHQDAMRLRRVLCVRLWARGAVNHRATSWAGFGIKCAGGLLPGEFERSRIHYRPTSRTGSTDTNLQPGCSTTLTLTATTHPTYLIAPCTCKRHPNHSSPGITNRSRHPLSLLDCHSPILSPS